MRTWLGVTCLALFAVGGTSCAQVPSAQQAPARVGERPRLSFEEVQQGFASPSLLYAPFAFWFWDAPLNPAQTARMAAEMARQGLNPGYAHPRNGLPHEQWLAGPWFAAFEAALAQAREAGAYLGYCDEYWWPSGRADGRVLAAHPELAAVSLDCRTFDLPAGETLACPASYVTVAAQLAEPCVPPPERPSLGEWIWCPDARGENRSAWFRCPVTIPDGPDVTSAALCLTADNRFVAYLDGERVADGSDWTEPVLLDVAARLRAGRHVLAIEATNLDGPCGLVFGLRIVRADGSIQQIVSGPECRTASTAAEGWTEAGFDDAAWLEPARLGAWDVAPWSLSALAGRRTPRTIRSSTLQRIGAGAAFEWSAPDGAWRIYSFAQVHHPGIDGSDVNYLDRRLAPAFLELAHEPYGG